MTGTLTDQRPPAADESPRVQTRHRLILLVLVLAGLLVDVAAQTPADGFALFAATLVVAVGLVTVGDLRSATGRALVITAIVPAYFLFVRTSPWVVSLDVLAVGLLLALGASLSSDERLFHLGFGQSARLLVGAAGAVLMAPAQISATVAAALPTPDERRRDQYAAIGRGVGLALPVVAIVGLLLASADAVFASLLDPDLDFSDLPAHAILVGLGMCLTAALFVQSGSPQPVSPGRPSFTVGPVEGALVLGGLIAVYSLFAVARLLVTLRGNDYVLETTGLTYAEYARSGFFQLLWAAGITLVVLVGLRSIVILPTRRSHRTYATLSLGAVALTLVVVWAAIERLGLYDDAFGLTMLRLYSTTFAWWIGAVLVLTGLALVGFGSGHQWLPGAVLCSALVALAFVNIANPEQMVVERNVDRVALGADFDLDYALSLSDDSVPALIDALPLLDPDQQRLALRALCPAETDGETTSWNLSSRAATRSLTAACAGQ